ncbi:MAG: hypothetical protein ABL904_11450 [Hyphomicrobiaceae bacterium]
MMVADVLGFAAAALVLTAFCMRRMVPLRITALCSNLAFIAYALPLHLTPIWTLHAVLLPINLWRLAEELGKQRLAFATRLDGIVRSDDGD